MADGRLSLLLDAHVLIWLYADQHRLPASILAAIEDAANRKSVSAATVWELEIKRATGRLAVPADLVSRLLASGFLELPVRFRHAAAAGSLPVLHGDPFDRMLVAQAQLEGMTIVSADPQIRRYDVPVLATA